MNNFTAEERNNMARIERMENGGTELSSDEDCESEPSRKKKRKNSEVAKSSLPKATPKPKQNTVKQRLFGKMNALKRKH